jgi:hypothetical protein
MAAMVVTGLVAAGCGHLRPFRFEPEQPTPAASPGGKLGDRPLADLFGWVDEHAYVVRVLAADVVCSGTLIEHDRVLTAHHCVAARGADGKPSGGNVAPDKILVELGGDYLPWGEVGVRHVIAPPCGVAAGKGDVAVLVLERPLAGAASLSPELTRPPQIGEKVTPLGFGRCALSKDGIRRHQRAGGPIERLESGRFQLSAAICPGDSGGPVVSDSGELLGVISASVMDSHEETRGASEFIRVDRWRAVFSNAKLIAEGTNPAEIPPIDCFDP